jgi:ferric-dicitrate binding protein FerR (iron transport regulator)
MDKHYFLELLHKYLQGKATNEEQQFVLSYYNLFQSEPDVLALLTKEKKEELKNQIHSTIWQNISQHELPQKKVIPINRWFVRVAAAAILLAICSTGILFLHNDQSSKRQTFAGHANKQKENHLIRLPDGSTVIVNADSKLNYPSSFDGLTKREVYLEGQAYFDIKHNSSKPFIVHTGKLATTVLGTAFNVKAFPGDMDITVTVRRGKVKVSDQNRIVAIITPDQQIAYNKGKATASQKMVKAEIYLDWKEQDLLFADVTVAEATELLEERFNVKISFNDEIIKSNRFTTTLLKGESLEQVLKSICEFNSAAYQYDKENATVIISSDNKHRNN